jgi:molybdenum-dependent DNA-binding transcriptional regulator ModE
MIDAALFPALETLLAVAGTGSVAAAARQRHITSSAVSQQIRRLEAHFGIKLFERAGRGVRLTATGETALPIVRELWNEAEAAFGQLAAMAGRPAVTAAGGGERLSRQGAARPGAPRPARRGASGALRDRHHALARRACAWWRAATWTSRW